MSPRASGRVLVRSFCVRAGFDISFILKNKGKCGKKEKRLRKAREVRREGGFRVYAPTALSRFRSHRSLMVHPAPRMINAPVPKRRIYFRGTDGGTFSAYDAMVIDQAN